MTNRCVLSVCTLPPSDSEVEKQSVMLTEVRFEVLLTVKFVHLLFSNIKHKLSFNTVRGKTGGKKKREEAVKGERK